MDGLYHSSNNKLSNAVVAWVQARMASHPRVFDNHVDEIAPDFQFPEASKETLNTSLFMFRTAVAELQRSYSTTPVYALLVLPLSGGKRKFQRDVPPSIEALVAQLSYIPPSIIVVRPHDYIIEVEWEEYRSPLPFKVTEDHSNQTVLYREHRDAIGIHGNWEYARNIYLRYWTGA